MSIFLRIVLLLKVLVMLSLGSSAVWAECEDHETQASSGQVVQGDLMLAKSESEPGDLAQGGSTDDDDPDADEDEDDTQA
ncbi:hypothetical protein HCU66_22560 [Pseudomonas frederiksbergensis]|uniref:hypothetical protein n=1 Tax=Pseudomonas frederiksbergensis TaxID=104087 RepID=UPI0019807A62|nr:hypothetical protein [Pseudomonas frederiksbergensis]MBN3865002.1 hypothetical protein [Pseudomonas frederiksbergensis]